MKVEPDSHDSSLRKSRLERENHSFDCQLASFDHESSIGLLRRNRQLKMVQNNAFRLVELKLAGLSNPGHSRYVRFLVGSPTCGAGSISSLVLRKGSHF